jgi:hypothetical protein
MKKKNPDFINDEMVQIWKEIFSEIRFHLKNINYVTFDLFE